ncbi:MAG: endonuclease MutS2 [Chloroflexi bacterium]|nr:MAG: endonuclease MutS2 [Chloroflexota bacterium]
MNPKSVRALEFDKIRRQLADHTTFSAGHRLALHLEPATDFDEVVKRLAETTEARALLDRHGGHISMGGIHDVRPEVNDAELRKILLPQQLLDIRDTLARARTLKRTILRAEIEIPHLAETAHRIDECRALVDAISNALSDDGEVRDQASEDLARIRRDLRVAHDRLLSRLQNIVNDRHNLPYLQEPLVTQRQGRYVIPLKTEFKGRIPGIVHDTSASGATLFIEPLSVVDLGNEWRQLQIEETREVERILRELSGLVAEQADAIRWTVEALADLDLAFAKAQYAYALNATPPDLYRIDPTAGPERHVPSKENPYPRIRSPFIDLKQARHPLLDPDTVVPIDVHVGDEFRILVITGPNTGGKTVTLKTTGLLAMMAQAGLHIPAADGSALTPFDGIFADIGDEQSIEQSLSTFSSHMTNIIDILKHADDRSLVLLDELGAGTDPIEGSALARALLKHLLERNITALVATHYSELKVFAHNTEGVRNASVEFDVETLSPTYRLSIGLPGRSNALAIASRLGLDPRIIAEARATLSPTDLEVEDMLEDIRADRAAAEAARAAAEAAQQELQARVRELEERLAEIEAERREIINQARREAQQELEQLRSELRRLRRQAIRSEEIQRALERTEALEEKTEELPPVTPLPVPAIEELQAGDRVWVNSLQREGELTELGEDEAEVQIGTFRARVPLHELEPRARAERAGTSEGVTVSRAAPTRVPMELDLRGQTVEEADLSLEKYLDDAYLAGLPYVHIIHGKGTGALRRHVREALQKHPLVAEFRRGDRHEGGDGVTVVKLAPR